MDLRALIFYFC